MKLIRILQVTILCVFNSSNMRADNSLAEAAKLGLASGVATAVYVASGMAENRLKNTARKKIKGADKPEDNANPKDGIAKPAKDSWLIDGAKNSALLLGLNGMTETAHSASLAFGSGAVATIVYWLTKYSAYTKHLPLRSFLGKYGKTLLKSPLSLPVLSGLAVTSAANWTLKKNTFFGFQNKLKIEKWWVRKGVCALAGMGTFYLVNRFISL